MNENNMNGQTERIVKHLKAHPNEDVSAIVLHQIGSGKEHGYCASLSRRISDARKLGYNVVKSKDEWENGQRHTWYKLATPEREKNHEHPESQPAAAAGQAVP